MLRSRVVSASKGVLWLALLRGCVRSFTTCRTSTPCSVRSCAESLYCATRSLKHRSLSTDDPFGERSVTRDPAEGFYGAWSGVDMDAFATAAASEEVRTAHFGPEWSRFATVGRMSVKKMNDGSASSFSSSPQESGGGSEDLHRCPSAEELHMRELRGRRKSLEKNYSTYEEFVAREFGVGDDCDDSACPQNKEEPQSELGNERVHDNLEEEENGEVPLPEFMLANSHDLAHASAAGTNHDGEQESTTAHLPASDHAIMQRRATAQLPEPFMRVVCDLLGEPHGCPQFSYAEPLYWGTEDIIIWLTKMESAWAMRHSATPSASAGDAELLLMGDASMQDAFRMARVDGEFLLKNTTPATMFQVMRRWHLRRQEVAIALIEMQNKSGSNIMDFQTTVLDEPALRGIIESGRRRLDEVISKVTPALIQETICQCYLYCR